MPFFFFLVGVITTFRVDNSVLFRGVAVLTTFSMTTANFFGFFGKLFIALDTAFLCAEGVYRLFSGMSKNTEEEEFCDRSKRSDAMPEEHVNIVQEFYRKPYIS
jgi:hypothetical protein